MSKDELDSGESTAEKGKWPKFGFPKVWDPEHTNFQVYFSDDDARNAIVYDDVSTAAIEFNKRYEKQLKAIGRWRSPQDLQNLSVHITQYRFGKPVLPKQIKSQEAYTMSDAATKETSAKAEKKPAVAKPNIPAWLRYRLRMLEKKRLASAQNKTPDQITLSEEYPTQADVDAYQAAQANKKSAKADKTAAK